MKSPPPKKKTTATVSKKLSIDSRLTLDEAALLIASRTKDEKDTNASAKDRERTLISRAAKGGVLSKEKDGTFILGNLISWVRTKKDKRRIDKFNDLPAYIYMSAELTIRCEGSANATILAPTLEVCQERLNAAQRRVEELEKEVVELRQGAEKRQNLSNRNQENGRKNGKK